MGYKKKLVLTPFSVLPVTLGVLGLAVVFLASFSWWARFFPPSSEVEQTGLSLAKAPKATPAPVVPQKPVVPAPLPGERAVNVPILLYHYISKNPYPEDTLRSGLSTIPEIFDQQLALLRSQGYTTITFDELAAGFNGTVRLPEKPVIITVDDGYADFYFNAYPILQKYQMKAVVFIPTGLIGGGLYMTWEQIEELAKSPFVSFGAHTIHHYSLPDVPLSVAKNELVESKRVLEEHIGYPVNWFCYPYGAFSDTVVREVKKAGYIGAITTLPGTWQYKSRFYYIPRLRPGNMLGENFLTLVN